MAYEKQNFVKDQVLEAEHLNHIEDGIEANEKALEEKQPKGNYLTEHQKIKTINGQPLVGEGNIEIDSSGVTANKELKILFIGNSLTQDAVSYLPLLLDEIAPEVRYTIYDWYNGGNTLAQQYAKFTANTPCENFGTITNNKDGGWDVQRNTRTMKWVCENCDFDIVVIQEYSYYDFEDSVEVTNFNNVISYLRNNYGKPFKVYSYIDAPMRTRIDSDYAKAKKYTKLHITNSVAEGLVNPGSAVVYGIQDSVLKNLGDKGQLSADGTHTQEGLPCMIQSYVLALWVFEWLDIPKSILNSNVRMTSELYSKWQSFGPNLGSGVVEGTEAQYKRAQEIAIKAHKFGKQLLNSCINTFTEDSGETPDVGGGTGGESGGGESAEIVTEVFLADSALSSKNVVGSEYLTYGNQYTTTYDVYKVSNLKADTTYTVTVSHGLYTDAADHMPVLVVCDANGTVLDVIRAQQNTQTVHAEQYTIDTTEYEGASYMLVSVHESAIVVAEGTPVELDISVAHTGSVFKKANEVGTAYQTSSSQYTTTYNIYKASNTANGKYSMTIEHGLYSSTDVNEPVVLICDANGVVLEVIRTLTNVQKERTETFTVDMTKYANASYFVFVALGENYSCTTV